MPKIGSTGHALEIKRLRLTSTIPTTTLFRNGTTGAGKKSLSSLYLQKAAKSGNEGSK
jgi:hypothetical protein